MKTATAIRSRLLKIHRFVVLRQSFHKPNWNNVLAYNVSPEALAQPRKGQETSHFCLELFTRIPLYKTDRMAVINWIAQPQLFATIANNHLCYRAGTNMQN